MVRGLSLGVRGVGLGLRVSGYGLGLPISLSLSKP